MPDCILASFRHGLRTNVRSSARWLGPRFALALLALGSTGETRAGADKAPAPEPIPLEDLFRHPLVDDLALSPDGKRYAGIHTDEHERSSLLVVSLDSDDITGVSGDDFRDVYTFAWVDDSRLVFNVSQDKRYAYGLFVAQLGPRAKNYPIISGDVTRLISLPKGRPDRALVSISRSPTAPGGLAEVTLHRPPDDRTTFAISRTYDPPADGAVLAWQTDTDGELALCYLSEAGKITARRFDAATRSWRPLGLDLAQSSVCLAESDGRHLWVSDFADDAYRLRRLDMETGQFEEPVHRDPAYDLGLAHLFFSPRTRQLAGLRYHQRRACAVWFDPDYAAAQQAIDASYPETDNTLIDVDAAGRRFLFRRGSSTEPGHIFLVDTATHTLRPITRVAPWLEKYTFVPSRPISWRTRDGVKLEGYLTLPPGTTKEHPAPLVVLAHGGPSTRDTWTFDAEVQFLASRGYAVLQPNYRGSTGYAPGISDHADFDFRRMHDDVTDATRAMIRTGLIDGDRVAIMGGSFGGYLALTGVTFEHDLYRCAVSLCGVFDWAALVRSKRRDGRPGEYERLTTHLGDSRRERERYEAISPLAHADDISAPVFIAHGQDDHIVDVAQSKKLAAALARRGVPHETFFRATEGHGFYNTENRVAYHSAVEQFLATHLAARPRTP